jgi:hypothetical protein
MKLWRPPIPVGLRPPSIGGLQSFPKNTTFAKENYYLESGTNTQDLVVHFGQDLLVQFDWIG